APFSSSGPVVDLYAPGVGVVSSVPGGFASHSGTSVSAAFAGGAAALVWGINPGLSYHDVLDSLLAGASSLPDVLALNVFGALSKVLSPETAPALLPGSSRDCLMAYVLLLQT